MVVKTAQEAFARFASIIERAFKKKSDVDSKALAVKTDTKAILKNPCSGGKLYI
jgi:hypothetical protein